MRKCFLLVLAIMLGACSTHFDTSQQEGVDGRTIYQLNQEQAFAIAYNAIATVLPGRKISEIDGPVKGYRTWFRFVLDTYTQQVLVVPANHFIEVCLDEVDRVWVMLHSGSRGIGNRIGGHFTELAKREMERWFIHLPEANLAYLAEGSQHFYDYVRAVGWAQAFARTNREVMMERVLGVLAREFTGFGLGDVAVNCHHNYVTQEEHFGERVWVTRKGAVRAGAGELGIIPGSMGARSYIVRGKGNPQSFCSCSHGAGRVMSRGSAKKRFSLEDHAKATEGVECRKDAEVIDETPMAYKDIDAVMAAQTDLVEVIHTLKQVVCVKG